jgi:hypothetical protein
MKASFRSREYHVLLLAFLAYFLVVSGGVDFFHNHEPDGDYHDNCPACQWQKMSQDDFSGATKILIDQADPLRLLSYDHYYHSPTITSESFEFSCSSRAPPESA